MLDSGFYLMDCMEGMKQFPDKVFDLAIVDPPYGISIAKHSSATIGSSKPFGSKSSTVYGRNKRAIQSAKVYHTFDDSCPPDEEYFNELERVSARRIIWGGNFMLDYLGKASCLIIWDKGRRGLDQADCEIAWTNLSGQSRIFNFRWNGMLQGDMSNKEDRIHPTQKPVRLYEWLLKNCARPGDRILDTHVGSASSLIACHKGGYKYWGFEIDPVYYKLASERLQNAVNQVSIFD